MIDIRLIRESSDSVRAALARRDPTLDSRIDQILELDRARRDVLKRVELLKAERNRSSEEVGRLKQQKSDATALLTRLKRLSDEIKQLDQELRGIEQRLNDELLLVPNIPADELPDGDESANRTIRSWGDPPDFDFEPKPHWEVGEKLGILDLPRGAVIAGSGFPLFKHMGARLVRALINFMIDMHVREHGYVEVAPPLLVTRDTAKATGQIPDLEGNMYVTAEGLYLIPTAEVPVTNIHRETVLTADQLPSCYVAYTPCFRREAGAHGKDTRGIIRVHQFDKVELVRFCRPEESRDELETILRHAEAVLQRLVLPYRVVLLAAGDIGFASAMTYDLELWAAGVGKWLEVSSASTFTDFQSRRANIRYRPQPRAKPEYVHTLNASGVALPRTIIALLENNQQPDGSVRIPEALVPYLGTDCLKPDGGA
ncbi:MAG: serine--tRNA ligase [Gemmatimonadota bacterium]|nr:MAG: serine--tRNA ligase [Gemmatimonadota bacterium]